MQQQLDEFLSSPGRPTALALLGRVRAQAGFRADTPWDLRARTLLAQGRHDEVIRIVEQAMPGAMLSPSAHQLLSLARAGIGQSDESRRQAYLASVGLDVIRATGDGSAASPWHVLHVSDEYAFLDAGGVSPVNQRLVGVGDGLAHDVIECSDGKERHFLVGMDADE